jgi:hypothetical protein
MLDGAPQVQHWIDKVKGKRKLNEAEENMIRREKTKTLKRDAAKHLMRMNIYTDREGYVFYNELLMYLYRYYMISHLKIDMPQEDKEDMHEEAQKLLHSEEKITMRKIKLIKKKQNIQTGMLGFAAAPSNPMVRMLFVNMCLKAWLRFAIDYFVKMKEMEEKGIALRAEDHITSTESGEEDEADEATTDAAG